MDITNWLAVGQALLAVAFAGIAVKGAHTAKETGVAWTKIGDPKCVSVYFGLGLSLLFLGEFLQSLHVPHRMFISAAGCLVIGVHHLFQYKQTKAWRDVAYSVLFIAIGGRFLFDAIQGYFK